ncbi:helix-turn-helix domain-containing protein [Arthrobacter cupressi]|uniref:Helix-turn-helix domain-containing protein n=1 Tax=Arthrobacter cupressi TaxID=1045773 RepID=A0A1G8SPP0_9MICC|nr:helix-turn-helix domain-containing protein [Arthrobacter cupressi]NYD78439.1 hypothetical protein [Arthrobacter cupressi]SDJ31134.1 hypothetical protein SAMN05216555_10985 [Arthrobacter cupressi]
MAEQQPHPRSKAPRPEESRSTYLTRTEAANYLNIPAHWLANNTKQGPRYIKVGGLVRYSVEALDDFMSANEARR